MKPEERLRRREQYHARRDRKTDEEKLERTQETSGRLDVIILIFSAATIIIQMWFVHY